MKKSKVLAWFMAASLGAASLGTTAYSASFNEYMQQNLDTAMEGFVEAYDLGIGQTSASGKLDLNVRLGQGGKAMLGMMAPVDLSWLNDANLAIRAAENEGLSYGDMALSMNGTELLTVLYEMNVEDMQLYMQVPLLSDTVLTADYLQLMEQSAGSSGISMEQVQEIIQIVKNLTAAPPEGETVKTLVRRYLDILLSAYVDGESREEELTVGDLTATATMMEGIVTEAEALEMVKSFLDTVKTDEELKAIMEQAVQGTSYEGTLYEQMQQAVESFRSELDEAAVEEGSQNVVLRVWVDENGGVVGQQMVMEAGDAEQDLFEWYGLQDGSTWAFWFDMNADSTVIVVDGDGTLEGDQASGILTVNVNDTDVATIELEQQVNEELMKAGEFHGTYTIKPVIPEPTEEEAADSSSASSTMGMLAGMALTATVNTTAAASDIELGVMMSDTPLGYVTITTEKGGEIEYANLSEAAVKVNILDDEQMNAFAQTLDPEALLTTVTERLTAAGMPEEVLTSLMAQMGGMVEGESTDLTEESVPDAVDDYAVEESEAEAEEPAAGTAGGSLGAIGGAAAPVVAESEETTEEETLTGLMDWNNNH